MNTKWAIKNEQSRETGNIGHTRQEKQIKNTTQYVFYTTIGKHTNNVNKTWAFLQITGGKDEPNIGKPWILWILPSNWS